jgi:hypothetical protein
LRVVDPAPHLPPRPVFNFSRASPDSTTKKFSFLKRKQNQNKTKQTNKTSKAQRVHRPKLPNFQNSTAKLWKELKLENCKELFG